MDLENRGTVSNVVQFRKKDAARKGRRYKGTRVNPTEKYPQK
jgi:hypothetical protein